jgi:hypothetical protein
MESALAIAQLAVISILGGGIIILGAQIHLSNVTTGNILLIVVLLVGSVSLIISHTKSRKQRELVQQGEAPFREFSRVNSFIIPAYVAQADAQPAYRRIYHRLPYRNTTEHNNYMNKEMHGQLYGNPFTYSFRPILTLWKDRKGHFHALSESNAVILQVEVSQELPSLYIRSKKRSTFSSQYWIDSSLPERTYLIGAPFSNEFIMYSENNPGVAIIEMLSPEVLQAILDAYHCDIWFHKNVISCIIPITQYQDYIIAIPHLFPLAEVLLKEIDQLQR